jgi:DNA-binding transcriptional MerR regulator
MRFQESLALTPSISRVCQISCLTPRAVRYYEIVGLIDPPRDAFGHRRYPRDVQASLLTIAALRRADLPLADIREVLDESCLEARKVLAEAKLRGRLEQLARATRQVEASLDNLLASGLGGSGERPYRIIPMRDRDKVAAG